MARFTVWTNKVGDAIRFYIMGTFSGANEAEALDEAARDPGEFGVKESKEDPMTHKVVKIPFASFAERNSILGFTRDNYRVKKVEA